MSLTRSFPKVRDPLHPRGPSSGLAPVPSQPHGSFSQLSATRAGGAGPKSPTPPPTPAPLKRLGQIFFRAFSQSKLFSGAFGSNSFG